MKQLGGYQIEKELGRGATAQVFLATRPGSTDRVALKAFHPGLWDHEDVRKRALLEFRTVSALKHPHIVQVYEALWDQSPPLVVMEYVEGASLEQFQGRLPYILPEVAVLIIRQVLDALEYAHEQGIIHRDLKPANILVQKDGRVLVSDFGLAKAKDITRITQTGAVLGSPDYMSPEQARGDISDERSDLFAVASIFYFLVTGTRPFARPSALGTLAAVNEAKPEPPHLRNPKLNSALSAIILKGLSQAPENRYASAREFAQTLDDYLVTLGLNPDWFTLPAWIGSASEVSQEALRSVAQSLMERGEKLVTEKRWDDALRTLAHLGLVAPESPTIPRLMKKLQLARKKRGAFFWFATSGGAAAAILAIVVSARYFKSVAVVAEPAPAPAAAPVQVAEQVTEQAVIPEPVAVVPVKDEIKEVQAAPAPRPATMGKVVFEIAEGIDVFWDGRRVNPLKPLNWVRPGQHVLRLEKEGNPPIEEQVKVSVGEPTVIRVR